MEKVTIKKVSTAGKILGMRTVIGSGEMEVPGQGVVKYDLCLTVNGSLQVEIAKCDNVYRIEAQDILEVAMKEEFPILKG